VLLHPDLITPVCQASLVGHRGMVLFSGPYNEQVRKNLTVLASDDNGVHFHRALVIDPGLSGYSVRCAFSDRNLHSMMPLDPTHVPLKRAGV
jgi:hypothetical protein